MGLLSSNGWRIPSRSHPWYKSEQVFFILLVASGGGRDFTPIAFQLTPGVTVRNEHEKGDDDGDDDDGVVLGA